MFERLQELLQVWSSTLGEGVVVLTHKELSRTAVAPENQEQRFTVVVSKKFSALLLGMPQLELLNGNGSTAPLYQVGLTFEPDAITSFLTQLAHQLENASDTVKLASITQSSIQPNDATIQSEFTLALLELLSSEESHTSAPPNPINSTVYACQPLVEEALRHQVEQERLLHQVTTQIRQSLELPVILKTAVEQVRHFLQVDRLVIYQFDFQPLEEKSESKGFSIDLDVEEKIFPIDSNGKEIAPSAITTESSPLCLTSKPNWGCVTYEARASDNILSVLNLVEEQDCSIYVSNCRERYRQGLTVAIDDVESAYAASPCLLNLLEQMQVQAKLIAPIVVQNNLWGLLIAHQCFEPRYWQDSEKMFLRQIAEHLTVAIYQAQLYAQLQQQKTTLEQRVIERTQELRDTLQAAQAASLAKSEFLAAMSHELRTPLTCVIGMSATLLRWSFGQEGERTVPVVKQRRYLQTIQESGEHLLELINDILDLSQVEAGKAVLNISEFSLSKLTHQTVGALQEKALLRDLNLEMDFRVKPQSDRFCADQRRVRQILFNLLGNAVKFTPEGGQVTLRVWRENNLAVFQVEDTGIGIADDQLPLLFQKFQQLESVYHRSYEGTGLGLALTKQLVELHGGRIEVESVVNEGSVFTVWLPTQPIPSTTSAKATVKNNSKPQGSIVLVENHEETATPICEALTTAGYQVVWLIDGSTAIDQIKLLQPRAVIVDWQLPGVDGYEMVYSLRNSPTTQQIKILALTTPIPTDQEYELRSEVDDYLPKPIETVQLLDKITALMEN